MRRPISEIRLPIQTTEYTCGPAALLSYAVFMEKSGGWNEKSLSRRLGTIPIEGTKLKILGEFAISEFGARSFGENSWDETSSMIAVITEKNRFGEDFSHAVFVLGKSMDDDFVWWDPYHATIKRAGMEQFRWHTLDFEYRKWSINFPETISVEDIELLLSEKEE